MDVQSPQNWEDAFRSPVSDVLKLEQQLRVSSTDNRQKLRSLVGASYRNLLGTAELIADMDNDMRHVDSILGHIGQKCNSRIIEGIASNCLSFNKSQIVKDQSRYTFASQLAVLQQCPIVIRRLTKRKGALHTAAKALVISRLLHKTLSQADVNPQLLDQIRKELALAREKLLRKIDNRLCSMDEDITSLVHAMCAFSLTTSSTPTDILQHYHHIRLEAIVARFATGNNIQTCIMQALRLYAQTLHDTQEIFPGRLAESLAKLKKHPLILEEDLYVLPELNLRTHLRWLPEEVRNYTPWPRHDELHKPEAEKKLGTWAKATLKAIIVGIRKVLTHVSDLETLATSRREILESWSASSGQRVVGLDPSRVLEELREVLNACMERTIRDQASSLTTLTRFMIETLESWLELANKSPGRIWDGSVTSFDISGGAVDFRKNVLERSRGRSVLINRAVSILEQWESGIQEARRVIRKMRDLKWDGDSLDIEEDEFGLESRQESLSEEDPRELELALCDGLNSAFETFRESLQRIVTGLDPDGTPVPSGKAIFLIRALREMSLRVSKLKIELVMPSGMQSPLDLQVVNEIHLCLAKGISSASLNAYEEALERFSQSNRLVGRSLWEGSPQLPVQPSTHAYLFLHRLNKAMADAGSDVWAPGAVTALKSHARNHVVQSINACVRSIMSDLTQDVLVTERDEQKPEPQESADEAVENELHALRHDKLQQLLYDALYLERVLTAPLEEEQSEMSFAKVIKTLYNEIQLQEEGTSRFSKSANDYWKKTYLLFGLLV